MRYITAATSSEMMLKNPSFDNKNIIGKAHHPKTIYGVKVFKALDLVL